MAETARTGHFWDVVAGHIAPPTAAQMLGWKFAGYDAEAECLSCTFEATAGMLNPAGTVQGGMLAAMLDEATGPVAAAISGGSILSQTLEMKVSYLRPARVGTIHADARVLRRGRDILFLEGRLKNAAGDVLAVASLTARIVPLPA